MAQDKRGLPHVPPATVELFDLLSKGILVQAVSVAAKLGVADAIGDGGLTAGELAVSTGANPSALYRLLRALTALGIVEMDDGGRFELTALGSALRSGPGSARERAIFFGEPFVRAAWSNLYGSVMSGEGAFRATHGLSLFEYVERDADAAASFHGWMTRQTWMQIPLVLEAYDFSPFHCVVDVGGGRGALLSAILEANPAQRGILFDLPEVVAAAEHVAVAALRDRCDRVGGSFFDSIPSGGDCYLLKLVLHDWDDERALTILRKVRRTIAGNGRLLVMEFVMPPGNEFHLAKFLDLTMLVLAEEGRERTESEFRELFRAAGFELTRVVPTASPLSILEGMPSGRIRAQDPRTS